MPLNVLAVLSETGSEEMEDVREEEMGLSTSICFMAAGVGDGALWAFLNQEGCFSNFALSCAFCNRNSAVFFPATIVVSIKIIGL